MCFFFFKQKTAYEMRISDWSSDVCSSDLPEMDPEVSAALKNYLEAEGVRVCAGVGYQRIAQTQSGVELTCEGPCDTVAAEQVLIATGRRPKIGRASCRLRVGQYV